MIHTPPGRRTANTWTLHARMANSGRSPSGPSARHAARTQPTHYPPRCSSACRPCDRPPHTALAPWRVRTWSHACATSGHASMKKAVSTCGSRRPRSAWLHGTSCGVAHGAPHGTLGTVHCSRCPAEWDAVWNAVQGVAVSTWGSAQCTASQAPAWCGSAASDSNARDTRRSSAGGGTGTADAPGNPGTLKVTSVARGWVGRRRSASRPRASRRGEADPPLRRGRYPLGLAGRALGATPLGGLAAPPWGWRGPQHGAARCSWR